MGFPRIFFRYHVGVIHYLLIPAFLIFFITVYKPYDIVPFLGLSDNSFVLNVTLVTVITLVCLVLSRLILFFFRNVPNFGWLRYLAWCFLEVLITSAFIALYLMLRDIPAFGNYFRCYGLTLGYFVPIFIIPYIIITLALMYKGALEYRIEEGTSSKMKFYDYSHSLKCTLDSSDVLYIASQENYIDIHYTQNGIAKHYNLRGSMKSVEEMCTAKGIIRCHRSYFVNVKRIKALTRGKEGLMTAQLNDEKATTIPVSKTYYDTLANLL